MTRFFNIIPAKDRCCILLYGDIGEGCTSDSSVITQELLEAEQLYKNIDVRINSQGGEVFAGIGIFNALRNSTANITIYIDGIAASMASVIASCGKPVKMGKYARMMIHAPSCGAYGNRSVLKEVITQLDGIETLLGEIYADRTGKSANEIKSAYFDGRDHWFTADEALSANLIDEIFDTDPVPAGLTNDELYTTFTNRLNNKTTMFNRIKKMTAFAACNSEEEAVAKIKELEAQIAASETIKGELDHYKQADAARKKDQHKAIVAKAVEELKISTTDQDAYLGLLESDETNGLKVIASLKPITLASAFVGAGQGGVTSAWEQRQDDIKNKKTKQ